MATAVVVAVVSFLIGAFILEQIIWLVLAVTVFVFGSSVLEYLKQSEPKNHPDGVLGFGSANDDIGAGVIAFVVFFATAYFQASIIALVLIILFSMAFMELEEYRRWHYDRGPIRRSGF